MYLNKSDSVEQISRTACGKFNCEDIVLRVRNRAITNKVDSAFAESRNNRHCMKLIDPMHQQKCVIIQQLRNEITLLRKQKSIETSRALLTMYKQRDETIEYYTDEDELGKRIRSSARKK